MNRSSLMIWIAFWALFVLHQDVWFWADRTLVWGFMPVGLLYHVGFSAAAAGLWFAATWYAWPDEIEAWAAEPGHEVEDQGTTPNTEGKGHGL